MKNLYKILLFGLQGSGKGTQSELLSQFLHIPAFGTGQLIRDEIETGSEFGRKFEKIIVNGDLISDVDAAELLKRRLSNPDTQNGYILDGYPRNLSQMSAFDFDTPTLVFIIEISEEESLKRLGGRLTCSKCKSIQNMKYGISPGDSCECGGVWEQRDDDKPNAIKHRLDIYRRDTALVIAEYEKQGIVKRVNGMGSPGEVFERLKTYLECD